MLFTKYILFALPFIGSVCSAPTAPAPAAAGQLTKRDSIIDVIDTLQSAVAGPIASLNAANAAGSLTSSDAETYLQSILSAIQTATADTTGSTARRRAVSLPNQVEVEKRDDLSTVGAVLAQVIEDLVNAIEEIADDLKALPLVGTLIIDIDSGLDTLLLGVEVVLEGVIEILQGLLSGVASLLEGLGNGLLASLLGL